MTIKTQFSLYKKIGIHTIQQLMSKTIRVHDKSFELFISKEQIKTRVQALGAAIAQQYEGKNPLFVGILNGAFLFTADLVRACPIKSEVTFLKVQSYDGLQSTGKVTTLLDFQQDIKDRHIILVEDIIDTGTTFFHLLPTIQAKHPASIAIASLLRKPDAIKHPIKVDFVGFDIPNKFVIGYGLDYNEQARNLPAIYKLIDE